MDSPLDDLECFGTWRVCLELFSKAGVQVSLLLVGEQQGLDCIVEHFFPHLVREARAVVAKA